MMSTKIQHTRCPFTVQRVFKGLDAVDRGLVMWPWALEGVGRGAAGKHYNIEYYELADPSYRVESVHRILFTVDAASDPEDRPGASKFIFVGFVHTEPDTVASLRNRIHNGKALTLRSYKSLLVRMKRLCTGFHVKPCGFWVDRPGCHSKDFGSPDLRKELNVKKGDCLPDLRKRVWKAEYDFLRSSFRLYVCHPTQDRWVLCAEYPMPHRIVVPVFELQYDNMTLKILSTTEYDQTLM